MILNKIKALEQAQVIESLLNRQRLCPCKFIDRRRNPRDLFFHTQEYKKRQKQMQLQDEDNLPKSHHHLNPTLR